MEKPRRPRLIIFYKNPVMGKVKTRLAATVGDRRALDIYRQLTAHTKDVTENLPMEKIICYTDAVDRADIWPNDRYAKATQQGDDLGARMENAFAGSFSDGFAPVCIIGTDCYELSADVILKAFRALESDDAVVGPAKDGGYYLLGLNKFCVDLFRNKQWSTSTVLSDTLKDLSSLGWSCAHLPTLRDVDKEDDLPDHWKH